MKIPQPTTADANNRPKALVVGAGFGGLAAALRLRRLGYRVRLVERLSEPGGRARVFRKDGFIYDAGPTVITAPFLFEELFELFGKKLSSYADLVPVDPWYRILFEDSESFDYGGTVQDTLDEIRRFNPDDQEGYLDLLAHSEKLFETDYEDLGDHHFSSVRDMVKAAPALVRLKGYLSVYGLTSRYLQNEYLRKVFSLQPLLVGGNPFDTTCVYSLIHFLERKWGVWFAMGGTGALVSALVKLAEEEGIEFEYGRTVDEIVLEGDRAIGIRSTDGKESKADFVVCNADAPAVYRNLLPESKRPSWPNKKIDRLKYSMGLFVMYFGTRTQYPEIAHHTIMFGPRYKELLKDIFDSHSLADDFSLYLHRPTATDPSLAPDGCDGFYVLSPVPNQQSGIDWDSRGPEYAQKILNYLEERLMPGLSDSLVHQFHVSPKYFQEELLSYHGAGFSIAPILTQSAWFRFHNESEDIPGLYFVGAGTHPGAGLPGVLTSAKVVERLLKEERKAA